ncbi:Uncharacterised protein [Klebsiella pneumoniae]|nr:Uncharacterised protein [Klebsiella pneumoniae]
MNHIEFIEKNVREELMRQGFTQAVAQGGHTRRSICTNACRRPVVRGRIFDDVLRHAKLWAEKQTLPSDKFEKKRAKPVKQQGLF